MQRMKSDAKRLFDAAKTSKGITSWAELGRLLGESDQTLTNWKVRGIPKNKLMEVAAKVGASPYWIETGKEIEPQGTHAHNVREPASHYGNTPEEQHLINLLREHQIDPSRIAEIIGEMIDTVERKAAGQADAAPTIPQGLPRQPRNLGVGGLTGHVEKPARQQAPGKLPKTKGIDV